MGDVHTIVPEVDPRDGSVQVNPSGVLMPSNAVPVGIAVVNDAPATALGPLFVRTTVSVNDEPAIAGFGVKLTPTDRVEAVVVVSVAVPLLLVDEGSGVVLDTVAVVLIVVPDGVVGFTFETTTMEAVCPAASASALQVMVPDAPTAGIVQENPEGVWIETNVAFEGTVVVKESDEASDGPLLVSTVV